MDLWLGSYGSPQPNYLIQTERQHTNALRYEELYQILGSYAPVRISFCIVRFSLLLREAH